MKTAMVLGGADRGVLSETRSWSWLGKGECFSSPVHPGYKVSIDVFFDGGFRIDGLRRFRSVGPSIERCTAFVAWGDGLFQFLGVNGIWVPAELLAEVWCFAYGLGQGLVWMSERRSFQTVDAAVRFLESKSLVEV